MALTWWAYVIPMSLVGISIALRGRASWRALVTGAWFLATFAPLMAWGPGITRSNGMDIGQYSAHVSTLLLHWLAYYGTLCAMLCTTVGSWAFLLRPRQTH